MVNPTRNRPLPPKKNFPPKEGSILFRKPLPSKKVIKHDESTHDEAGKAIWSTPEELAGADKKKYQQLDKQKAEEAKQDDLLEDDVEAEVETQQKAESEMQLPQRAEDLITATEMVIDSVSEAFGGQFQGPAKEKFDLLLGFVSQRIRAHLIVKVNNKNFPSSFSKKIIETSLDPEINPELHQALAHWYKIFLSEIQPLLTKVVSLFAEEKQGQVEEKIMQLLTAADLPIAGARHTQKTASLFSVMNSLAQRNNIFPKLDISAPALPIKIVPANPLGPERTRHIFDASNTPSKLEARKKRRGPRNHIEQIAAHIELKSICAADEISEAAELEENPKLLDAYEILELWIDEQIDDFHIDFKKDAVWDEAELNYKIRQLHFFHPDDDGKHYDKMTVVLDALETVKHGNPELYLNLLGASPSRNPKTRETGISHLAASVLDIAFYNSYNLLFKKKSHDKETQAGFDALKRVLDGLTEFSMTVPEIEMTYLSPEQIEALKKGELQMEDVMTNSFSSAAKIKQLQAERQTLKEKISAYPRTAIASIKSTQAHIRRLDQDIAAAELAGTGGVVGLVTKFTMRRIAELSAIKKTLDALELDAKNEILQILESCAPKTFIKNIAAMKPYLLEDKEVRTLIAKRLAGLVTPKESLNEDEKEIRYRYGLPCYEHVDEIIEVIRTKWNTQSYEEKHLFLELKMFLWRTTDPQQMLDNRAPAYFATEDFIADVGGLFDHLNLGYEGTSQIDYTIAAVISDWLLGVIRNNKGLTASFWAQCERKLEKAISGWQGRLQGFFIAILMKPLGPETKAMRDLNIFGFADFERDYMYNKLFFHDTYDGHYSPSAIDAMPSEMRKKYLRSWFIDDPENGYLGPQILRTSVFNINSRWQVALMDNAAAYIPDDENFLRFEQEMATRLPLIEHPERCYWGEHSPVPDGFDAPASFSAHAKKWGGSKTSSLEIHPFIDKKNSAGRQSAYIVTRSYNNYTGVATLDLVKIRLSGLRPRFVKTGSFDVGNPSFKSAYTIQLYQPDLDIWLDASAPEFPKMYELEWQVAEDAKLLSDQFFNFLSAEVKQMNIEEKKLKDSNNDGENELTRKRMHHRARLHLMILLQHPGITEEQWIDWYYEQLKTAKGGLVGAGSLEQRQKKIKELLSTIFKHLPAFDDIESESTTNFYCLKQIIES